MTVLFVNACLRGEDSRTLELCREYLEGVDYTEVTLGDLKLDPFYGESVAYRAQLEKAGVFDDSVFDLAKQFAEAEEIVIGAPLLGSVLPSSPEGLYRTR